MIFGIFLGAFSVILFIAAGIAYARAVAATTPPPFVLRALPPEPPPVPAVATPEPSEPDEWDLLMGKITQDVESGRLRL